MQKQVSRNYKIDTGHSDILHQSKQKKKNILHQTCAIQLQINGLKFPQLPEHKQYTIASNKISLNTIFLNQSGTNVCINKFQL